MKTAIVLLLCCASLCSAADLRQLAGPYIAADAGRMQAWLAEPVAFSNVVTVTEQPANPVAAERYSWAWWMVATSAKYAATNSTKLANLAVMAEAAKAADSDERDGILADASMLSEVENNLTRNVGDWTACLSNDGSAKSITNSQTIVTQYRWQALGFDHLPNGMEIEAAQR